MRKVFMILILSLAAMTVRSQVVYEDINNTGIYEFLDELANLKMIMLNSAIRPYSRQYIAQKLVEAKASDELSDVPESRHLNPRQKKELHFYLQDYQLITDYKLLVTDDSLKNDGESARLADRYDYKLAFLFRKQDHFLVALNPLGFHYRDSLFTFSLRPVLGFRWMTNENGAEYHRWWGGSMYGYIGKHLGFYASLSDNNESVPLSNPSYFTMEQGSVYKGNPKGGVDFTEMRGGIVASVKWGSIGILNDRVVWGDNYHGSNILSGKAPAFPYIQLHLNPAKWFDFTYIHGWLNSNVIDSSRSYYTGSVYREVFRNKFIAANMFTFIPWKGLNLSLGNSIIYSDDNVHLLYLVPFLFFNAADAVKNNYSNNGGSNSQLFFNISSRQIRHLHLFFSLYVDEWKMSRLMKKDQHNFTSLKAGFRVDDLFVQNVGLTCEYTRTQPMTYDHYIPATTFASNGYVLGSYLRENSQEIYTEVSWHPLRGLLINASYTLAQHGEDVPYLTDAGYIVDQVPFLKNKTWQNNSFEFSARYEFVNSGYFYLRYLSSDNWGNVNREPAFMAGKTSTFIIGMNIGF